MVHEHPDLGRHELLVNSAGVLAMAPLAQFTLEDFDRTVAVNLLIDGGFAA